MKIKAVIPAVLSGNFLFFCIIFPSHAEQGTNICRSVVQTIENGSTETTRATTRSCNIGIAGVVQWAGLKIEPWRLLGGSVVLKDEFYPPIQLRAGFSDEGPDMKSLKIEVAWIRSDDETLPGVREMKTAGVRKIAVNGEGKLLLEGGRVIAGTFTLARSAELDLWRAVHEGPSLKDTVNAAWAVAP